MSYEAGDAYDLYKETERKARKEHRCDACGVLIKPSDRYTHVTHIYDGRARSLKRCQCCQLTHLHLRELCFECGDMWPDERLNCGLRYESEWESEPPEHIQALAFGILPDESP